MNGGIKLKYFLPEYFNEARENFFQTQIGGKLSNRNVMKSIISKLENKNKNFLFYKIICFLFVLYAIAILYIAYNQGHQSTKAISLLTILFVLIGILGWRRPLVKLSNVSQALPPAVLRKKLATREFKIEDNYNILSKRIKLISLKHVMKLFLVFLIVSLVLAYSLKILQVEPDKEIVNNFLSDLLLKKSLSSNLYMNYLIVLMFMSFLLVSFSNIHYSYEVYKIRKSIKDTPFVMKIMTLVVFILIFYIELPNVYSHLGGKLNEVDFVVLLCLAIFIYLLVSYIACFSFMIVRTIAILCEKHIQTLKGK